MLSPRTRQRLAELLQGPMSNWPVGSVFTSVLTTNPAEQLGYGVWVPLAAGRVLIGVDVTDPSFDTPEEVGGAKTHTLTVAEMPSHTHVQDAHSHVLPLTTGVGLGLAVGGAASAPGVSSLATAVNQVTGGGAAHNNLPPFCTVFYWKRVA